MRAWNQEGIIVGNYDIISLLQLMFCKNSKFEGMHHCNRSSIIEKGSFIKYGWSQLELQIIQYLRKIGSLQVLVSKKHSTNTFEK